MGNAVTLSSASFGNDGGDPYPSFDPISIEGMATYVNGRRVQGRNISMVDGVLYVDGKVYNASNPNNKEAPIKLEIVIHGNVQNAVRTTSGNVTVHGDTGNINTMSGDVSVHDGDINGWVNTMSGDVICRGNVSGRVSTMSGDVRATGSGSKKKRRGNDSDNEDGSDNERRVAKKKRLMPAPGPIKVEDVTDGEDKNDEKKKQK